ncbi:MAG: hypothetical protein LBO74_02120 [Candidatus Symbiothrix sp.]|jgi:hypothetical protein|nr:hypothetical protein [Candidatus Symbiothrix sp.]
MDIIIDLYKYFSRFVPKPVLEDMFIQPGDTRDTGYDEVRSEILAESDENRIDAIEAFVVSINENFVSQRVKNTKGVILFVEYGKINLNHDQANGVRQALSVTVVNDFSIVDNDNLNEILLMNECWIILDSIIQTMNEEQGSLDFCGGSELVTYPVDIRPVDPVTFYGRGGWSAIFENSKTIL